MRKFNAVFANFICHFGEDKVLLDYARQIVVPAFTDTSLTRTFGPETSYVIRDSEIIRFDGAHGPVVAVGGRFIKNTVLRRHQFLDPKQGLIADSQSIESAPSAVFLLILNNHRLIYFPETPFAPDLISFEATARNFIHQKWAAFVGMLLSAARERGEKTSKAAIMRQVGRPVIDVVPLANELSVASFLGRFSKLQRIDFKLVRPNHEVPGGAIWRQFREENERLLPDKTVVRTEKSKGFDLDEAGRQIHDAAASGLQRVQLFGRDLSNNRIDGDNDSFKVSVPITDPPQERRHLLHRLYEVFIGLQLSGVVGGEKPLGNVQEKLRDLDEV